GSYAGPRGATPTKPTTSIGSASGRRRGTSGARYTPGAPRTTRRTGSSAPSSSGTDSSGAARVIGPCSFVVDPLVHEVDLLHRHLAAALGGQRRPDPLAALRVRQPHVQHVR